MAFISIESPHLEFDLNNPLTISRSIYPESSTKNTGAFYLPHFTQIPFEAGGFIGDIDKGGSCNVRIQSYSPHNLTHIETSAHIVRDGNTLDNFSRLDFQGLALLIDISSMDATPNKLIGENDIINQLEKLNESCKYLAIKTVNSKIDMHTDFSGTSPIALDPEFTKYLSNNHPNIIGLFLDLPSADLEDDGGKLLAHRNYFALPEKEFEAPPHPRKFIGELAYFSTLSEGYYYCILTPPLIRTDAVITDIIFYPQRR